MADNALTLLEQAKTDILKTLPSGLGPDRWWALAVQMTRNPQLAQCTRESLVEAVRTIAHWGLELDGVEAVIVKYGQTATPQAQWQGLVRRAIEAGAALHIYAELIREGEPFKAVIGPHGRVIEHQQSLDDSGRIVGAYANVLLPGGINDYELFRQRDIEAVKKAALRVSGGKGPSPAWRDWEGEMIRKSVIRRLCKRLVGKRDGEAAERYQALQEDMKRVEPLDPTPELSPEEMPRAAEPEVVEPEAVNPKEEVKRADSQGTAAATSPPSANGGRTNVMIDERQMKEIEDQQDSTGITPKQYKLLLAEFKVTDDRQLEANQVPAFLKAMHAKANAK